jgi:hypothetical protein
MIIHQKKYNNAGERSVRLRYLPKIGHLLRLTGAGCLIYLFHYVDMKRVVALWYEMDRGVLFVAIALTAAQILLKFIRWHLLVRSVTRIVPLMDNLFVYMNGLLWGLASPGRIGEFYKCRMLKHNAGIAYSDSILMILIDKIWDLLGILVVGGGCTAAVFNLPWSFLAGGLLGGGVMVLMARPAAGRATTLVKSFLNCAAGKANFAKLAMWKKRLLSSKGGGIAFLAVFSALVATIQAWGLARYAFDLPVSLVESGLIVCLFSLTSAIPLSYMGFGVNEVILLAITEQWMLPGCQPEVIIAFSVSLNILLIVSSLAICGLTIFAIRFFNILSQN